MLKIVLYTRIGYTQTYFLDLLRTVSQCGIMDLEGIAGISDELNSEFQQLEGEYGLGDGSNGEGDETSSGVEREKQELRKTSQWTLIKV